MFDNSRNIIIIVICLITALLFLTYSLGKIDGRNSIVTNTRSISESDLEIERRKDLLIMNLIEQNKLQEKIIRDSFRLLGIDPNQ